MGINQPSSHLERLKYDPKDYADIFPYAEAFEEIRRKIGQDFSLRKLWEWARANVFEIQKEGKWVYVVKLPHPEYLTSSDVNIKDKVKAEIALQKKFMFQYETLIKNKHKKYLSILSSPTNSEIYSILFGLNDQTNGFELKELKMIRKEQQLVKNIQIPSLSDLYQWEIPIILMDKIPGVSLRFEIMRSVFSPLFERYYTFWTSGNLLIKSDKTLYENCKEQNISDKKIAENLKMLEKALLPKIWKLKFQNYFINPWMLESDPAIMMEAFIKEFDAVWEPDPTIFTQLYGEGEKGKTLQKTYNFFLENFPKHPDPNLHNFIITPDHKLWIIDFW